jgi:hypothetical protein
MCDSVQLAFISANSSFTHFSMHNNPIHRSKYDAHKAFKVLEFFTSSTLEKI